MNTRTAQDYQEMYSDFYKDAHGFRPRFDTDDWSVEAWEKEFEYLRRVCDENETEEEIRQTQSVKDFEQTVVDTIASGAGNRETAILWLKDAEDTGHDDNYFEYCNDLPYGYVSGVPVGFLKEAA